MLRPDEVEAMLRLHGLGWGTRRIAKEFGCGRNTVKRYVVTRGWTPYGKPRRDGKLDGLDGWLEERFFRHAGNADVVRQELKDELSIEASLRTVERAVAPYRRLLEAEAKATVRFETPPGRQLQIDFGESRASIGDGEERVQLFVATLGYSRRTYVHSSSVYHVGTGVRTPAAGGVVRGPGGGVPALRWGDGGGARGQPAGVGGATRPVDAGGGVQRPLPGVRGALGARSRACAPYRARTKGKDENGVRYVKRNAIAGRRFESWAGLEGHLARWMREVADVRCHGTTGELPAARFAGEADRLRPCAGRPPFGQLRDLIRTVHADCAVLLDTNAYSVPWRLIGERVRVVVSGGRVRVHHDRDVVAEHDVQTGRHARVTDPAHLAGLNAGPRAEDGATTTPELLRSLDEYAAVAGGRF